jgi:hypothetical protein
MHLIVRRGLIKKRVVTVNCLNIILPVRTIAQYVPVDIYIGAVGSIYHIVVKHDTPNHCVMMNK